MSYREKGYRYNGIPDIWSGRSRIHMPQKLRVKEYQRTPVERERDLELASRLYIKGASFGEIANAIEERARIEGLGKDGTGYRIGVTQISHDIGLIWQRWREHYLEDTQRLAAEQLARLDRLESEYWMAWEESREEYRERETVSLEVEMEDGEEEQKGSEGDVVIPRESVLDEEGGRRREGEERNSREEIVLISNAREYRKMGIEEDKKDREERERSKLKKRRVRELVADKERSVKYLQGIERCIEMRCKILGIGQTKTVNVNWKQEALAAGYDPERVIDVMVEKFLEGGVEGGQYMQAMTLPAGKDEEENGKE